MTSCKCDPKEVAVVTFDIKTGAVLKVANGEGKEAEAVPMQRTEFNKKHVTSIPDHTIILSTINPTCFTYVYNGQLYEICF